jgi:hypothetical protein
MRLLIPFIIAFILVGISLPLALPASTSQSMPQGSCPAPFTLMMMGDHEGDGHHHIGLAQSLNGDNYLCMLEVANGLHVHIDNVIQ